MTFRNILAAATFLALPLATQAQPVDGPYVALGAGLNIMQQVPVKSIIGIQVPHTNISTNLGGVGVLSGGWGFGNGLRAEPEFDHRYNGLDRVHTPIGSASLKGSEQKFGPMVNLFYDFTALTPVVTPYVGIGAGYQWDAENVKIQAPSGAFASARETEGAFAYQAICRCRAADFRGARPGGDYGVPLHGPDGARHA
jgi:OmpA-OmpF porin, OOP family